MLIAITGTRNIEEHNGIELKDKGISYNEKAYNKVYKEIDIMIKYILLENNLTYKDLTLVSGMARGVDEIFADYAIDRGMKLILSVPETVMLHKKKKITSKGIKSQALKYSDKTNYIKETEDCETFEIQKEYNNKEYMFATIARNQHMVDISDMVISYKKDTSGGTQDCIKRAKKSKKYLGNVDKILKEAEEKYNIKLNETLNIKLKRNIIEENTHVFIHGCNCYNTMGSGVAKTLRDKYPSIYTKDTNFLKKNNINLLNKYTRNEETEEERDKRKEKILGKFSYLKIENRKENDPFYIFNLYSQFTYWDKNRFNIKSYEEGMTGIIDFLIKERKNNGKIKISSTAIGLSLGKGKLSEIYPTLKNILNKYDNSNIEFNWCLYDSKLISKFLDFELNLIKENIQIKEEQSPSI